MNELALICGIATGGAFGIWLGCYVFTREGIERAVQAKIEGQMGGERP